MGQKKIKKQKMAEKSNANFTCVHAEKIAGQTFNEDGSPINCEYWGIMNDFHPKCFVN